MNNKIQKIFKKKKNIVIGAIHFPPLLGYPKFPGFKVAEKNTLTDLNAFESGGADSTIFENNYDTPHTTLASPATIASMAYLGEKLKSKAKKPMGVNVLWNDFYSALSLAKLLNLEFIRIPVFIDKVKNECGIVEGKAREAIKFRKKIKAENVALFTDIHVKHAKLLSRKNLVQSAKLAIKSGSDALIITGNWTGQSPNLKQLELLRKEIGNFPIFAGSGVDEKNIKEIFKYANGAIVSTSLKKGSVKKGETNVKSYSQRIDPKKVLALKNKI